MGKGEAMTDLTKDKTTDFDDWWRLQSPRRWWYGEGGGELDSYDVERLKRFARMTWDAARGEKP